MITAKMLYNKYKEVMSVAGVQTNEYETMPEADRLAWQAAADLASTCAPVAEVTASRAVVDVSQICGLNELIAAADDFVSKVDKGIAHSVDSYSKFKTALNKIGSEDLNLALRASLKEESKLTEFYHIDGKPAKFDIDEELGELLIACQKSLDFIHNGPAVQVTEDIVTSMYDGHITKLIPKLEATIANRITVAYPFHILVDMGYSNLMGSHAKVASPLNQMAFASGASLTAVEHIETVWRSYEPGKDIAPEMLGALANLTIHMQQNMNIFGWTWDDVKLRSRQLLSQ